MIAVSLISDLLVESIDARAAHFWLWALRPSLYHRNSAVSAHEHGACGGEEMKWKFAVVKCLSHE
jgi:hypothetical protein